MLIDFLTIFTLLVSGAIFFHCIGFRAFRVVLAVFSGIIFFSTLSRLLSHSRRNESWININRRPVDLGMIQRIDNELRSTSTETSIEDIKKIAQEIFKEVGGNLEGLREYIEDFKQFSKERRRDRGHDLSPGNDSQAPKDSKNMGEYIEDFKQFHKG